MQDSKWVIILNKEKWKRWSFFRFHFSLRIFKCIYPIISLMKSQELKIFAMQSSFYKIFFKISYQLEETLRISYIGMQLII